jgi:single-strand DNA-binding protein
MSRDYQQITVVSRLTADPVQKYSPDGKEISTFDIACNDSDDKVNYFSVEFWEKPAEIINKHCKKGSKLLIIGRMNQQRWDDKTTGDKKSKYIIKGQSFEFMGSKSDAN